MIVDSWFEEGPPQEDGRRFVKETHVDDKGSSFTYEMLGMLTTERKAQIVSAGNG